MKHGFSLIELSIVLVILGLLTGGILTGQSLIRASELRAVATEYQRYQTAAHTFRDKYFAIPGDMGNATAFWGKDNAHCSSDAGTAATPGTCNGNSDGQVWSATAANATGELYQFWKQLSLAGLIEGSYTGISGPGSDGDHLLGINSPKSKMSGSGWGVEYLGNWPGDPSAYAYDYGNYYMFGAAKTGFFPITASLKAEEAWNIDTKLDDGKPASGKIMARDWFGFGAANTCTTSTSPTDYAGVYKLSDTTITCSLMLPHSF